MIYTPQMKEMFHRIKFPQGMTVDVVEYPFHPPFLAIRFYYTQWASLSESERLKGGEALKLAVMTLTAMGAKTTLEPIDDRIKPL